MRQTIRDQFVWRPPTCRPRLEIGFVFLDLVARLPNWTKNQTHDEARNPQIYATDCAECSDDRYIQGAFTKAVLFLTSLQVVTKKHKYTSMKMETGLMIRPAMVLFMLISAIAESSVAVCAAETRSYNYDPMGRLVSVSTSGGPNEGIQVAISYDHANNRTNYNVSSSSTPCTFTASADYYGSDEFSYASSITRNNTCAGSVTLSYSVQRLSGSGTYDVGTWGATGPFDPANSTDTTRAVRISPWKSTINPGDNLIVKVIWAVASGSAIITDADTQIMFCDDAAGC